MARSSKARATVICHSGDKVLLVRKPQAKWTLPGGKLEAGESPVEAAVRELIEETGVASDTLEFLAVHHFESRTHHVFRLAPSHFPAVQPQNEIADCRWFMPNELETDAVKRPCAELLKLYAGPSADTRNGQEP